MTPTEAETELYANKLVGKINYFNWRWRFDCAHKVRGTYELLTGDEKIRKEPNIRDYYAYIPPDPDDGGGPTTRSAPSASKDKDVRGTFDSTLTLAAWQVGVKKWEDQKERLQLAKRIILDSISPSIAKLDWYKKKEEEWAAKQAAGNNWDPAKGTDKNKDKGKDGGKKVFTVAAIFDHDVFTRLIHQAFDRAYPPSRPARIFLATCGTHVDRSIILLDSGTNEHVFNDKKLFSKFAPLSFDVATAGGVASLQVEGGGDVSLDFEGDEGIIFTLVLSDVAYYPTAYCNLVSLSLLSKKANLHREWSAKGITLKSSDRDFLTTAAESGGLFILRPLPFIPAPPAVVALTNFNHPVWEWHRCLGHLGWQSMIDLLKVSTGILLTEAQIKLFLKEICPVYTVTKALIKIPRDPTHHRSSEKG
ncbi:Uncharacterized protein LA080_002484 [Diaporthe eres]|nr:Uncharacterized protein LA080_002484 [Diaporthe eres]